MAKIQCETCTGRGWHYPRVWSEEKRDLITSPDPETCVLCNGTGEACRTCRGHGVYHTSFMSIMDIPYDCPDCDKGTRRVNPGQVLPSAADTTCGRCNGTGRL